MIGTILALRRAFVVALGLAVVAGPTQFQAQAQGYPNKVISILVPAAAGGPTDTVARLIAESDRKSTRLNSSHVKRSRMPSSA